VIDNLTMVKEMKPPNALLNANGGPFVHNGITYNPKFQDGELCGYFGRLKNLRLLWKPEKISISNSIHKYYLGDNSSDFHLFQMHEAVEKLSIDTGIRWEAALVTKLEFGCNIETNVTSVYRSLQDYGGKHYLPMEYKGKVYGQRCILTDYTIKGYDKSLQMKLMDGTKLERSLFRWEIAVLRTRTIQKKLGLSEVTLQDLLVPKTWRTLADFALFKFRNTIRANQVNLHKIENIEKLKVLAVMLQPDIKEHIRLNKKDTYRNYRRIFASLMNDRNVCPSDDTELQLSRKFDLLLRNQSIL
jgi:hypothetical protein